MKVSCLTCKKEIDITRINRHIGSKQCNLNINKNKLECKYCGISFQNVSTSKKANHSRWCDQNPLKEEYLLHLKNRKGRKNVIKDIEKWKESIANAHKRNCYINAGSKRLKTRISNNKMSHSPESIEKIRTAALKSKHQRICKSTVNFTKKDGSTVRLDSSWEVKIAIILEKHDIEWIRPKPLLWIDSKNIERNYFSDFYLTKYDLYLDPKNDYCKIKQKEKIDYLLRNFDNIVILGKDDLNEGFILRLIKNWCAQLDSNQQCQT
jgi:hypothetical protein